MKCIKCGAELPDGAVYCHMCGKRQQREPRKVLKRANGTGTVYRLSGRRKRPWVAAKNKIVIGYYETKTAALEALERLTGRSLNERYNMTFAEVFEAWNNEHKKDVTKAVADAYINSLNVFKTLHRKKFREIRTVDYQTVLDGLAGKSRATLAKHKQLVNQMSVWAMREEIVNTNFASFVKLPTEQKKEKEIFSESDIEKLCADGSEPAWVILMLIGTGMRINELFSLPIKDYYGTYCIGGEKTEAGKNRVIPIRPEARQYFSYFANIADGPLLLSGYAGNKDPKNFRNRDFYPLLDRLGIERKTPHATRHTYASRSAAAGMKPEILQKILGHADYSTTANIYVHTNIEELVRAVEQ